MWSQDMFKGFGYFVILMVILLVLFGYILGKIFN